MKLIDKLKNALFEEEYVEVEEKPKAPKQEKPIAKKIVLPEQKKEPIAKEVVEEQEDEVIEPPKKDFKFPAILEDDFITPQPKAPLPQSEPVQPKKIETKVEKRPLYAGRREQKETKELYGKKETEIKIHEYGSYEKKQEKKEFKPSPIISPIYGVLDQNYKKEDIVTRKEVRISSSYASKNLDIDSIRAKAFGTENDDIFEEELTSSSKTSQQEPEKKQAPVKEEKEEVMLDISDNAPNVPKVTVGDAEEYFRDLGLEYNIDYKDISHEKATGRRSNLNQDNKKSQKESTELEDNLFDLIDSMYDEKKGE